MLFDIPRQIQIEVLNPPSVLLFVIFQYLQRQIFKTICSLLFLLLLLLFCLLPLFNEWKYLLNPPILFELHFNSVYTQRMLFIPLFLSTLTEKMKGSVEFTVRKRFYNIQENPYRMFKIETLFSSMHGASITSFDYPIFFNKFILLLRRQM